MPDLETLEILKLVNCPETFTPDMRCIMGESPSVRGYFVLAGMNSAGLSFGGGAGRFSAEGRDSDAGTCVPQAEDESSQKASFKEKSAEALPQESTRGTSGSFQRKNEPRV
ncbi:pyruvate dehydrogenase phosphatase regulatory subunit, mitochondrial-like [Meles meles]|uniref:pyruvate dehydrogenase phosphatase regulatory subunit, mitochondrial-like n=1 Tax=Meles meles TaxID=9662 RepID=UPI001E6A0821|nr:pyruvate dehydrogenase phosphatase regulatory subunit, mitochondrial-like [Meles meles]